MDFVTSDSIDEKSQEDLGPSAFSATSRPYLARVLDFSTTDIRDLELSRSIQEVDSFILDLAKERELTDTRNVYEDILQEIKMNLGIHPDLEPLRVLERLTKGVRLLRQQNVHKKIVRRIQEQIEKERT